MGFFKKLLGGIGDVAKFASPILALSGVGAPLAAGLGAAGGALGTLNDKEGFSLGRAARDAAIGGGTAYAAGSLPGTGAKGSKLGSFSLGDILKSAGGWAMKNPEALLGGASMGLGALQQGKAGKMQQKATDFAMQDYASRAPARQASMDFIQGGVPQVANLSALTDDPYNPY